MKHSGRFSRGGCSNPSEMFANFSYTKLINASVLPSNLTVEEFSPCDYLPHLQKVMFATDELDDSVTYETFVVVPDDLKTSLQEQLGNETEINGSFVSILCCFYLYTRLHFLYLILCSVALEYIWT